MIKLLIKIFCWLHNFSYKIISSLVVRENGGLHPKHRILDYHKFFLDNISATDSVLDIGCGNGSVAFDMSKKAAKVVAIDISEKNIKTAQSKFNNNNLEYIIGDATTYKFEGKFDAITLSNVLEHIENRVDFLSKTKLLAPKILIRVPLITREWLAVYKKENGIEYRTDKTHFVEYTEEGFAEEIGGAGLTIESWHIKFGELYAVCRRDSSKQ